jgi:hypothetical protein
LLQGEKTMSEINGTGNNSIQNMLESLDAKFTHNNSTHNCGTHKPTNFAANNETTNAVLEELLKRVNTIGTNSATPTTSTGSTAESKPAVQPAPPKKKKKKRGFFKKLGGALKKIGGFIKKALPIISTVAMLIPGVGTAIGGALKIATAAMGAFDAIKNKNPLGFVSSVAGAFTGGIAGKVGGFLDKAKSFLGNTGIGNVVTKGLEFFNKAKDTFTNFTGGLGGKVTDFLTSKGGDLFKNLTSGIGGKFGDFLKSNGADWIKNLASNAGSKVTNWLNDKATSIFDKVTNSPFIQKARSFFDSGIGKTLLDLFTKKTA